MKPITYKSLLAAAAFGGTLVSAFATAQAEPSCVRTITADVVAFDQPLMWNRLGAQNINGMVYALRRDVVETATLLPESQGGVLSPGMVSLRPDKRPRPLTLRMAVGDCLEINFENLLAPVANPFQAVEVRHGVEFNLEIDDQVAGRYVGLTSQGVELVNSIMDDGSYVGQNPSSLAAPGQYKTYTWSAKQEGTFPINSLGAPFGGEAQGGNAGNGLFGALNVAASGGSGFYRSQLTREEMDLASGGSTTAAGHPIIDYEATYPNIEPWITEGKAGLPIINMVTPGYEYVHSDLNGIVAYAPNFVLAAAPDGPHAGQLGHFPANPDIGGYPLEKAGYRNPTVPNRLEPFREFTVIFHDEAATKQAFPEWYEDPVWENTLHSVRDSFMINYGSGGIGSEIIANRLGVGPMHDCINCTYEEFFLAASTVGDVGMLVDIPANVGLELCDPALNNCLATGPKANFALFPDDPSNVHHSYTGDSVAFRNLHSGAGEQHIYHLHNHQWLFNANDDNSNYLDAQALGPGSGYSYWVNFGGSGNRNKTAGDAIFHCHFYPHFAQGMWEMWRVHDVMETGTTMAAQDWTVDDNADTIPDRRASFVDNGLGIGNGTPAAGARALPDGEIVAGTPIPAVVPMPGKPMAPMPAPGVTVKPNPNLVAKKDPLTGAPVLDPVTLEPVLVPTGSLTEIPRNGDGSIAITSNPGFPFWIAGMEVTVGQRPTTPPLDMLSASEAQALKYSGDPLWQHPGFTDDSIDGWDGGLPRFALEGYAAGGKTAMAVTRLDFTKDIEKAKPVFFPEAGTDVEQLAMIHHAQRCFDTFLSDGIGTAADCYDDVIDDIVPGHGDRGGFIQNGNLPVAGAPYQEPCIDDQGRLLDEYVNGKYFSGELVRIDDPAGMNVYGASPHNAADPRIFKAANIQFDAVLNKLGYHFPQQRIIAFWEDAVPIINKQLPPEPFVFRMNTFDCAQYTQANLVPKVYELDDYQVRTPTDIIGQHIHLPKWDLTSADGSANGWNYEDGGLSPEMVMEVIHSINNWQDDPLQPDVTTDVEGNPVVNSAGVAITDDPANHLHGLDHPFFGATEYAENWVGARSVMQRWFTDPVVNVQGVDRGLGIIFTHDHYGPSTHQQVGLYATLLVEPAGSKWVHNETGVQLGQSPDGTQAPGRSDGGPTSWQAAILTGSDGFGGSYSQNVGANEVEDHREFYMEYADFQHAYQPGVYVGADQQGLQLHPYDATDADGDGFIDNPLVAGQGGDGPLGPIAGNDTFRESIQPSQRLEAAHAPGGFPTDIWEFPAFCAGDVPRPCPEAITADDPGLYVVNYRAEPLLARIYDPDREDCPDGKKGCQAAGKAGDLAYAMDSNTTRAIPELNVQPKAGDSINGTIFPPMINAPSAVSNKDPFTPMMRAYDGDRIHIKWQSGGQEEAMVGSVHGIKWLQSGSGFGEAKNSGWRNAQTSGISAQYAFRTPVFADRKQRGGIGDYAYSVNSSLDGWTTGTWGLLRSYSGNRKDMVALPGNDPQKQLNIVNDKDYDGTCPKSAPKRFYDVTAVLAEDVLPGNPDVTIQDLYPQSHMGRAPEGPGTLVYNSRTTVLHASANHETGELPANPIVGQGPLHDPAAILYVFTEDLIADDAYLDFYWKKKEKVWFWNSNDPNCINGGSGVQHRLPGCPVKLKPDVPVEPLVLRANAGECIEVTLRNKVLEQAVDANGDRVCLNSSAPAFRDIGQSTYYADTDDPEDRTCDSPAVLPIAWDTMPDLASGNAQFGVVTRDRGAGVEGMTSFNNNLMAPSAFVGLHPALVEYDVTRSDGTDVGQNPSRQTAPPGGQAHYQWYAGHIEMKTVGGPKNKRNVERLATPIEFGGFNIMPADKIKQGQKGAVAAGVIYPEGSTWETDPGTRMAATVTRPDYTTFRDFTTVWQKGVSLHYADSSPVHNSEGEGEFGVSEDPEDMGHQAINYATEPLWFRFGLAPCGEAGCSDEPDSHMAFSNDLVGGDPETPVFNVTAGEEFRKHVLMPFGPGRVAVYDLHGHTWQRDPYLCKDDADLGILGKCDMGNGHAGAAGTGSVGSQDLGWNPIGFSIGAQEWLIGGQHFEIVIPSAGGKFRVTGDYLFRDRLGLGSSDGLWGIVRVE